MNQPNQFAWITEVKQQMPYMQEIYSDSSYRPIGMYPPGNGHIEFTGMMPMNEQTLRAVSKWCMAGNHMPIYTEEWLCLYCGSARPLPETNCKNCGAPRSWALG